MWYNQLRSPSDNILIIHKDAAVVVIQSGVIGKSHQVTISSAVLLIFPIQGYQTYTDWVPINILKDEVSSILTKSRQRKANYLIVFDLTCRSFENVLSDFIVISIGSGWVPVLPIVIRSQLILSHKINVLHRLIFGRFNFVVALRKGSKDKLFLLGPLSFNVKTNIWISLLGLSALLYATDSFL